MNTEYRNTATMLRRGFLAAVVALLISAHPHAPTGSAQSLSPALPAKEYVYANAKLLAVEVSFALSVTPPTASIPPGAAQDYTVTVAAPASFTGEFTFAANNLPPEITPNFNPPTITGSGSTTLTLTASPATPIAPYPFIVTATSEGITGSGQATLGIISPFPVLVNSVSFLDGLHSFAPPIMYNGEVYVSYSKIPSIHIGVAKSADPGTGFTELDSANSPQLFHQHYQAPQIVNGKLQFSGLEWVSTSDSRVHWHERAIHFIQVTPISCGRRFTPLRRG